MMAGPKEKREFGYRKKTAIVLGIVIVFVGLGALKVGSYLPFIGDVDTPANSGISDYYIMNAEKDTNSANIVTAILADYRGFDTLFETCVLFLSAITAMTVLSTKEKVKEPLTEKLITRNQTAVFGGTIMDAAFRVVVPIVLIYGIYVLIHGEISLGGGFQAGALLACTYLLDRIIPSFNARVPAISEETGLITAGIGVFLYMLTGLLPMFNGGSFFQYDCLPFGGDSIAELHGYGILMIEVGVTVAVMGVIITIFEVVLERTSFDD